MPRSKEILSALASLSLIALAVGAAAPAAAQGENVKVCHRAGNKFVTIHVSPNAVAQHVEGHGDLLGACGNGGGGGGGGDL